MSETIELPAKVAVKGGVVAYLSLEGAMKAAAFYEKAFAAKVAAQYAPDEQGRTMHIHLYVNGSSVMLSDFYPEHGHAPEKPGAFNLMLPVTDIQMWFKRAVDAGCTPEMPPEKMFWGDTYGQVRDPFGVIWSMNQEA
jgi:PhnB protein